MSKIQIRRGTTTQWTTANTVLASGELGLDETLDLFKMGDGTSNWASLPFYNQVASDLVNAATPNAEVILGTNMVVDPHAIDEKYFGLNNGGGSLTQAYTGGKRRVTWGTNATSGGGANAKITTLIPGDFQVGEKYTVSLNAKFSRDQTLSFGWYIKNAAGSSVGGGAIGNNVMVGGVERRLTITGTVAAVGTNLYFYLYTTTNSGGSLALAGDWLEYNEIQAEKSLTASPFYDGYTATSGDISYRWADLPNASASYKMFNNNLARRTTEGTLQATAPILGADVVNKEYLESQHAVAVDDAVGGANNAGGVDDSAVFQAAYDKARGTFGFGGKVIIPPGSYHLSTSVKVYSNIKTEAWGATVRKYGGANASIEYSAFEVMTNGIPGYGSGAVNIEFEGLTFKGSFGHTGSPGTNGCAVTLHHAKGVTFRKCIWDEAIISGHAIDLMGCDGVLVDQCIFKGFMVGLGREYVEAIQCDYSMYGAGGSDTIADSFDGLPTINVKVINSQFLPLANPDDATKPWPAPNPLGVHSRVDGRWFEGIKFLDNYVEGGCATDASVIPDTFSTLCRGWLHFFGTRNSEISGNIFKNTRKYQDPANSATFGKIVAAQVIKFYAIGTGTLVADVKAAWTSQTITPMSATNILIERNKFIGFSSATNEAIIDIRGTSSTKFRDIDIARNEFIDCAAVPGVPSVDNSDPIYLQDGIGVDLINNDVRYARGLVYAYRVDRLNVRGGSIRDIGNWAGRFSECNDVVIDGVNLENFGGAWYSYNNETLDSSLSPQAPTAGFTITGGSIVQKYTSTQLAALGGGAFAQPITLSGNQQIYMDKVRAPYNSAAGYASLIYVYSNATDGRIENNRTKGWGANTVVSTALGVLKNGVTTAVVSQANIL